MNKLEKHSVKGSWPRSPGLVCQVPILYARPVISCIPAQSEVFMNHITSNKTGKTTAIN